MKTSIYACLMLATFVTAGLGATPAAPSVEETNVNVKVGLGFNNCWGANANCPVAITIGGALTGIFDFNVSKAESIFPETGGKITSNELVKLEIPIKKYSELFYSYIPTDGSFAGKELYLAFVNEPPKGRLLGQTEISIYRLVEGQKQSEKVRLGSLTGATAKSNIAAFTFEPNGDFGAWDPVRKKYAPYPAGQVLIPGKEVTPSKE